LILIPALNAQKHIQHRNIGDGDAKLFFTQALIVALKEEGKAAWNAIG